MSIAPGEEPWLRRWSSASVESALLSSSPQGVGESGRPELCSHSLDTSPLLVLTLDVLFDYKRLGDDKYFL